jgi:hypothetical protein
LANPQSAIRNDLGPSHLEKDHANEQTLLACDAGSNRNRRGGLDIYRLAVSAAGATAFAINE